MPEPDPAAVITRRPKQPRQRGSAGIAAPPPPESPFPKRKKTTVTRSTRRGQKSSDPPTPGAPEILFPAYQVERWPLARIIPNPRNARKHRPSQVAEIVASILEFGWTFPMLVDPDGDLVAGEGRYLAAKQLAIVEVPVIVARRWTEAQKRAYRLADKRCSCGRPWNMP